MQKWSEPSSTDGFPGRATSTTQIEIAQCWLPGESVLWGLLQFRTLKVRILKVLTLCESAKVKQRYLKICFKWSDPYPKGSAEWSALFFDFYPIEHLGSRNKFSRETKVLISWDRDLSERQDFFDLENSDTKKLKYPSTLSFFNRSQELGGGRISKGQLAESWK